ncbi:hypothetical protein QYF36_003261 [Acer negundo]|nr:hypothetical protein QYF36_003261 [Acer negundo]
MNREVSEEEVRTGLFGIGGLKASGPYGYPVTFFQNQWAVCKQDLVRLVVDSFKTCTFFANLNQTLIVLIPKVPSPLEISQLCPISLCKTAYKIISKVVVQILKDLMPTLISLSQVAFILGRQILDNIVVAQEVLHKFKIMKVVAKAMEYMEWVANLYLGRMDQPNSG